MRTLSLSQKVLVTGIAPAALCAAGMAMLYGALTRTVETNAWVVHTNEVLAAAHDMMSSGLAAQSGERGYVITGSSTHLEAFTTASRDFTQRSNRLASLVADNPLQSALLAQLTETFARWRNTVALPVIEARQAQPPQEVTRLSELLAAVHELQAAAERLVAAPSRPEFRVLWQERVKDVRDHVVAAGVETHALHDLLETHKTWVESARSRGKTEDSAAAVAPLQALISSALVRAQRQEENLARLIRDPAAQQLARDFEGAFASFVAHERDLLAERKASSHQTRKRARNLGALAAGFACVFAITVAGLLSSRLAAALASLRKAADAVASGDLEARADVEGDDQLATVAARFNDMAVRLAARDKENDRLSKLSEMLIASHDADEASSIISSMLCDIFPDTSGVLYVTDQSRASVEPVASWKLDDEPSGPFDVSQCWAYRRGQVHVGRDNSGALGCKHVPPGVTDYVCVPLVAQGEALSIVHLRPQPGTWLHPHDRARLVALGKTAAERIAMALSNLRLRERLRDQSVRDPLTGLFNRRYLEETLERELARASREGGSIGVVVVDIDHFKRFNDNFGHQAGDVVLREVGRTMTKGLRKQDVACRYGGEELVLVLPGAALADTQARAQHLCEDIRNLVVAHEGHTLGQVTASFGVCAYPTHAKDAATLIRLADEALYAAKTGGRNRVVVANRVPTTPPAQALNG